MKERAIAVSVGIVTLVLGLATRAFLEGWIAKYLGVALWATLVYALVVLMRPAISPSNATLVTIAISFVVELLQLTPGPMALARIHRFFALVFGTTFNALDLPSYVTGAVLGAAIHMALVRRRRSA
jgi:hypothetical protein